MNPQHLLEQGGLMLLAAIVFAESGLLVGFFLPGDSLLFVAGFLTSTAGGHRLAVLPIVIAVTFVAAVAGDQVGYLIGRRAGASLQRRPDGRIFRRAHVERAAAFFERHGPKTVVLARFVPVVRTFVPVVAGAGAMPYRTFVTFNLVGGVAWAGGVTTAGHFLGQINAVRNHIEIAILAVVAVSVLPVAFEFVRHRRSTTRVR